MQHVFCSQGQFINGYTINGLSELLQVTDYRLIRVLRAHPEIKPHHYRKRDYYAENQLQSIKEALANYQPPQRGPYKTRGLSRLRMARECGVSIFAIDHLIMLGVIPAPKPNGAWAYYSRNQIPAIKQAIAKHNAWKEDTITEDSLADLIGVTRIVIQHHRQMGNFPTPQKLGKEWCYTQKEVEQAQAFFKRWRYAKKHLFNLHPGLKQLGVLESEYIMIKAAQKAELEKRLPKPAESFAGRKGRFYTLESLKPVAKWIREQL